MDDHTLKVLEFDKVLERTAAFAVSPQGREEVMALRPGREARRIRREVELVSEIRGVLQVHGRLPLDGLLDIRDWIRAARPEGALLDGIALRQIASTLAAGRLFRDFTNRLELKHDRLADLAAEVRVFPEIEREIQRATDADGRVVDSASQDLREIRAEIREIDEKIRDLLDRFIQAPGNEEILQEKFFTLRDGRHVLPVKAPRKGSVQGIIHGRSDTANTVFIEPTAAVDLGNDRRDLGGLEAAEVRRILSTLTARVRESLSDLEHNVAVLARADCACARAAFAERFGLRAPLVESEGPLELLGARHPILLFSGVEAVPLELSFGAKARGWVLSGPNTGGKTVALKTVGLLCLMAQAGMHVPAGERSRFPLFQAILADIGDEQSIEESLSTFSSHLTRMVEILESAGEGSLVLLDEMGAATDPVEGAALACAILEKLTSSGAWWLATTHLGALKVFAHGREGVGNASMEFDEASGRPTFRIAPGLPGSSRAIATARALGVPAEVIEAAEANAGKLELEMERLINDLKREAAEARAEKERFAAEREAAGAARKQAEETLAALNRSKNSVLKEAHEEGASIVAEYRAEAERVLGEMKKLRRERPSGAVQKVEVEKRRLEEVGRRAKAEARRFDPGPEGASGEPPAVGQKVALRTMQGFGVIKTLDEERGKATVMVGMLPFEVPVADLIPLKDAEAPGGERRKKPEHEIASAPDLARELHLLGLRVEEALDQLAKYLDDALLADLDEVRIVHGFGTGALQKAVAGFLKKHPAVESFRPGGKGEGGAGATVAKLK